MCTIIMLLTLQVYVSKAEITGIVQLTQDKQFGYHSRHTHGLPSIFGGKSCQTWRCAQWCLLCCAFWVENWSHGRRLSRNKLGIGCRWWFTTHKRRSQLYGQRFSTHG